MKIVDFKYLLYL